MAPVLIYLGYVGGTAAGLQVARGVIRGAGQLACGHPGAALVEVACGVVAPLRSVYDETCKLGGDALDAILNLMANPPSPAPPRPKRRRRAAAAPVVSVNGVPA